LENINDTNRGFGLIKFYKAGLVKRIKLENINDTNTI